MTCNNQNNYQNNVCTATFVAGTDQIQSALATQCASDYVMVSKKITNTVQERRLLKLQL